MKKFISAIIALAMVMAMVPMTMASAAEPNEISYWETKIANLEVENAALGKTFIGTGTLTNETGGKYTGSVETPKATDGRIAPNLNKDADGGYGLALYQEIHKLFGKIDLGKKDDIKGFGIYRYLHDGCLDEIKFYGSDEDLTKRADILEKATYIASIAADTESTDASTGAVAVNGDYAFRYVYMITEGAKSTHINEVCVYSDIEYMPADLTSGLTGIDNNGAEVTRYTDGSSTNTGMPLNGWVKYDLGANYDLKWLSFDSSIGTWWWQDGIYVKAGLTDDMAAATTVLEANKKGISSGRKMPLKGIYRYIWLCADKDMHMSKFKVYGYPTTVTEQVIEFENYIGKFEKAYNKTAIASSSYGVTASTDKGYIEVDNLILHTHSNYIGNDKAVFIRSIPQTEAKTLEFPVKITGDSWYSIKAHLGGAGHPAQYSTIEMTLVDAQGNETKILDRDYQNTEVADWTGIERISPASNTYTWGFSGESSYIKRGDYTLKVKVNPYNDNAVLILDDIRFTPFAPTEVKADQKTTIELEDLDVQYANAHYQGTSGGKALYSTYGTATLKQANVYKIPVNVEKAGRYDISTVMNKSSSSSYSTVTVLANGTKLYDNTQDGEATQIPYDGSHKGGAYAIHKYMATVELPAGESIITLNVGANSNLHRFAADCITIEKSAPLTSYTISPTAASNIDEIDWYTDGAKTTKATVSLTDVVDTYTPENGVTKITHSNLKKKGFGSNYLSIRNVFADDVVSFTLDDTLTIEATDYYNVSYAIGGNTGYAFDGISVTLEDVNDPTKTNVITRYIPEDYSNDNGNVGASHGALNNQNVYSNDFNEIAKIEEGEYKVTFTIYKRAGDDTYTHMLTLSDIHLDATEPANIPAEAKVVFEVEDYTHYGASLNQQEGGVADMSGNGIAWTHYGTPRGNVPVLINIPVNVETEDDYIIATHMAKSTAGNTYIYVDGEQVFYNYTGGALTGKYLIDDPVDDTKDLYPMATYKEKIHLTEGEHLITVSGSTAGSLLRFAVDYVSLEKYYENHVTQSSTTRIEIEDYAEEFAAAYGETEIEDELASYANPTQPVAKVKFTDTGKNFSGYYAMMGKKETEEAKKFSVPVTIKESGYYNAKYRIGGTGDINTFAWLKAALIDEGGNSFSLSDAMFRATATEASTATQVRINDGNGRYTWQITSAPVYIPAGTYDLTFTINGTTFVFDYVDIMPFTDFVQVGEKIEYDFINMATHTNDLASEGTYQQSGWAFCENAKEKIEYPLTITEAGYYDMEAVMNYSSGDNTTRIKIMVDDSVVYDNRKSATDLSVVDEEGNRSFHDRYFPMHRYTGGKVYLEEGEHKLVLDMSATNEKFKYVYKFGIDYVKLTKAEDKMYVAGEYLFIETDYGKAVSGQAYMAFYKGDKLVDVQLAGSVGTTEEETVARVAAIPPTEDYDYIKLLVWGPEAMPSAFAIGFAK